MHPLARAEFDQGVVNPDTRLERMVLLLKPSPAQQAALDALVEAAAESRFAVLSPMADAGRIWRAVRRERSGVGAGDGVARGARIHGGRDSGGRQMVVFSGTAGQVFDAFHTEMHRYRVDGVEHIANTQDPQIPAALAGVVGGVVSLHDFRRRSEMKARTALAARPRVLGGQHALSVSRRILPRSTT